MGMISLTNYDFQGSLGSELVRIYPECWDPWTSWTQGQRNHGPVQCEVESLVMAGFRPGIPGGRFDWESLR